MNYLKKAGLALALVGCLTSLTGCLKGGSNSSSGAHYGYVTIDMESAQTVVKDDYGTKMRPLSGFPSGIMPGDYIGYTYTIDYGAQSSSAYIDADITYAEKYLEYQVLPTRVDTTTVLTNEMPISNLSLTMYDEVYAFAANKHIFLAGGFTNIPSDLKNSYSLSFDMNAEPTIISNNRVYELYLRSTIREKGEKTAQNIAITSVFDMSTFILSLGQKEKDLGAKSIYFRINYPKSIDAKTGNKVWALSGIAALSIN